MKPALIAIIMLRKMEKLFSVFSFLFFFFFFLNFITTIFVVNVHVNGGVNVSGLRPPTRPVLILQVIYEHAVTVK
jgi:hypothetical protein